MNDPSLNPYQPPQPVPSTVRFSLRGLLGTITIISICLGLGMIQPMLGLLAGILLTPAWARANIALRRLKQAGDAPSLADFASWFLGSLGIFFLTYFAAGIAFYGTCWAGFFAGATVSEMAGAPAYDPLAWGLLTGVILGGAVGFAALAWLARRFWRIRLPPITAVESRET